METSVYMKTKCQSESYFRLTVTLADNLHLNTRFRQLFSLYRHRLNYFVSLISRNVVPKSHTVPPVNVPSVQTKMEFFLELTPLNKGHKKMPDDLFLRSNHRIIIYNLV